MVFTGSNLRPGAVLRFGDSNIIVQSVAVDSGGTSAHITGPALWSQRIHDLKIPLKVA